MIRKLSLKRDVLTEIDNGSLSSVVGGSPTKGNCSNTCVSCLTYISCYETDCIA